ncbi:MAG: glutamate 5-kinase [Thiotrichaceae bacterium]|nr:glutamate 5-kinase [Thiotrichaceae bacterium]
MNNSGIQDFSCQLKTRQQIGQSHRWVVKIGSALLTDNGRGLDLNMMQKWVAQMATLKQQHQIEIVLVSSGAVAAGMQRLNWTQRPTEVYKLQAAAAVGQMEMVQAYEACFQKHQLHTAQILLTHDDLSNRQRYINARSTLKALIDFNVIPIVNENDTVATDEIKFGDNDSLAGLVTNLIEADLLVILTDQQGLYEADPRLNPAAGLISEGYAGDEKLLQMAGSTGGCLGRGGMATKIRAANLASRSGAATWIASGRNDDILFKIAQGESIGTLLHPAQARIAARKQWLASHLQMRGTLFLDDGAVKVLQQSGKSLLPIGVTGLEGHFARGDMVACVDKQGKEIARGLVNYNSTETHKIMRQPSNQIETLLGYIDEPELIHRDNLVLV